MPAGWRCLRMRRMLASLPRPSRTARWLLGGVLTFNLCCIWILLSQKPMPWRQSHFLPLPLSSTWSCRPVRLSSRPFPATALVSFPGSGNTWVRHLLQQATGVATGSLYNDTGLAYWGFPGESVADGRVLVIKTHEFGASTHARFVRAVLLLRDPFHALRAEFNRQHGGHLGHARKDAYDRRWHRFLAEYARFWFELYSNWLRFEGPLHLIAYGDLVKDTKAEMERLLQFLGVVVSEPDLQCMLLNSDGAFKRSKVEVLDKSPFSAFMRESIGRYAANLTHQLQTRFGAEADSLVQEIQAPDPFQ